MWPITDTWTYDSDVLAEIDMTTELMIAGTGAQDPLSQEAIDLTLGLRHA
jgi:hypothetical protein